MATYTPPPSVPSHSSPYSLCHTHSLSLPPHFVPPATPLTLPRPLTLLHTTFHISPLDCVLVPSPESHSPTLRELSRKNDLRSDVKFSPRQHISMLELVAARVILKSQFRDSKYYICRCKYVSWKLRTLHHTYIVFVHIYNTQEMVYYRALKVCSG